MRKPSSAPKKAFIVAGILACTACTALLGDFEVGGADGTSGGCLPTQKTCAGQCVSKDDATVGCAAENCNPCPARPNATASCTGGACSFTCSAGFADCDANPENGCETRTNSDAANCGACGKTCGATNTMSPPTCMDGKCQFACRPGFGHCTMMDEGGCETAVVNNPTNCGACGHSCLGGACMMGKCQPFELASANSPVGVAVDNTTVYYTASSQNYVQRVQRDGKCTPAAPCPQTFAASPPDPLGQLRGPASIVSDGNTVWFMGEAIAAIARRAATGGAITNWGPANSSGPGNLVVANGKVFWTNNFANADPAPHVLTSNLDGTGISTVATYAVPVTTFRGVGGITADATHIYWANVNSGIYRRAFGLAANTTCVEDTSCDELGSPGAVHVAVDNLFLYWDEPASGTVHRGSKTALGGGGFIATGQTNVRGVAVMGTYVYWIVPGAIRRAPQMAATCDAANCELVTDQNCADPAAIVAADDGIYWTNRAVAGGVYRLAK